MEELVTELRIFLELLDQEQLTPSVRERKAALADILLRIQASRGAEPKDRVQKPEPPGGLPAPPQMPLPEIPQPWLPPDSGPPPLPTSSLPEGYYEEAVPLSPGKAPEYITSNYDSDAMSSSYESYDDDEEEEKGKKARHQWPSEEAAMELVRDARICAFLLRKKRFGQWTKLLCVVKDTKLLCYKSSKDQQPQMELPLPGCGVTYVPKDGKKKKHELKVAPPGADPLVLAVQSREQAEQWLKVIREVCSSPPDPECPPPSSPPVHKTELEKLSSERPSSDGEGAPENGLTACNGKGQVKRKKNPKADPKAAAAKAPGRKITQIMGLSKKKPSEEQTSSAEEDVPTCGYLNVLTSSRWRERWCRVRDHKLLLHRERADPRTHVVSIPLRGCEVAPGLDARHPLTFRLLRHGQEVAVLEATSSEDMGRWIGILLAETGSSTDPAALHYDYIDVELSASIIQTAKQTFCFMNRRGTCSSPYLGGAPNGYAHPSSAALHYDDVPCVNGSWDTAAQRPGSGGRGEEVPRAAEGLYDNLPPPQIFARVPPRASQPPTNTSQLKGKKTPVATNGPPSKAPGAQQTRTETPTGSMRRTASNAEQSKYGKNRVEADARRLQGLEQELGRRKEALRARLAQLRKERQELRAALELSAGRRPAGLEEQWRRLEEECRQREAERVSLELELTGVRESLRQALAGGITLGLAIEPRPGACSPQSPLSRHRTLENSPLSSCETSDAEAPLPVNSAATLGRGPPAPTSSPCRGHVLRKAKEWELKSTS
ncbi:actin filament-associated protein 1 isoform X2 [Erinaceus europaeus]|uniref:Actin filament-associated protein 1 isoform X2 n=1 Tax=Erinaceus europaeus TaxID=9365 RepID=A0ABM3X6R3_ERIEU|nr:actin filament-associated protein 1 isoform X2 [Erinaceus europaeus]